MAAKVNIAVSPGSCRKHNLHMTHALTSLNHPGQWSPLNLLWQFLHPQWLPCIWQLKCCASWIDVVSLKWCWSEDVLPINLIPLSSRLCLASSPGVKRGELKATFFFFFMVLLNGGQHFFIRCITATCCCKHREEFNYTTILHFHKMKKVKRVWNAAPIKCLASVPLSSDFISTLFLLFFKSGSIMLDHLLQYVS